MKGQNNDVEAGRLLASLRDQAGFTQIQLAERADISRSMVAQIEGGFRHPSQKMVRLLCRTMNVPEADEQRLLVLYGFAPGGETPERIAAFLRADKSLSPEQAEKLAAMIREAYERAVSEK